MKTYTAEILYRNLITMRRLYDGDKDKIEAILKNVTNESPEKLLDKLGELLVKYPSRDERVDFHLMKLKERAV